MALLTFLVCMFIGSQAPRWTTIRVPLAFGNDEIRFDASRVTEAEVRQWIQLSPYVGIENDYLRPESVGQYLGKNLGTAPGEIGCGNGAELTPRNPQVLGAIRVRIHDLDPARYPPGLQNVVLYVKGVQSFGLWTDLQLLSFMKNCDPSVLASGFEGVKLRPDCDPVLHRIAKAKDHFAAAQIADDDWVRCAWSAWTKRYGPYPKAAWDCFLTTHGIHEGFVEDQASP